MAISHILETIMFKTFACALALGAIALAPSLAAAKSGGHMGGGSGMHSTKPPITRSGPQAHTVSFKKMKVLNCTKHPRGNGQGGVVMVTVCL
jgi:uncharacterized membrane protein